MGLFHKQVFRRAWRKLQWAMWHRHRREQLGMVGSHSKTWKLKLSQVTLDALGHAFLSDILEEEKRIDFM